MEAIIESTEPFGKYIIKMTPTDKMEAALNEITVYLARVFGREMYDKYLISKIDRLINEHEYIREIGISYGISNIPDDLFNKSKEEIRIPKLVERLFRDWGAVDVLVQSVNGS